MFGTARLTAHELRTNSEKRTTSEQRGFTQSNNLKSGRRSPETGLPNNPLIIEQVELRTIQNRIVDTHHI